jgi:hypothetical protein
MNKTGILVVLGFVAIIGVMYVLTSCCCQEQGIPALRPMPKCEEQQVQPTLQIPVTPTGK